MPTTAVVEQKALVEQDGLIIFRPWLQDHLKYCPKGPNYYPLSQEQFWEGFPTGSQPPQLFLAVEIIPNTRLYVIRAGYLPLGASGPVAALPATKKYDNPISYKHLYSAGKLYSWHPQDIWGRKSSDPSLILCQLAAEALATITESYCTKLSSNKVRLILRVVNAGGDLANRVVLDQVCDIKEQD